MNNTKCTRKWILDSPSKLFVPLSVILSRQVTEALLRDVVEAVQCLQVVSIDAVTRDVMDGV